MVEKAGRLLADLKQNDAYFINSLTVNSYSQAQYYEVPLLPFIAVDEFVQAYLALPNSRKKFFYFYLKKRYEFPQFIPKLKPEAAWWKEVVTTLNAEKANHEKTITGELLANAITQINEYIKLLEG